MAVAAFQQNLGVDAVLDHLRRAPLARDHRVVAKVPPEVIREILRPAVELPAAADIEGVVVDDEDAARPVAGYRAERADVDPVGSAMAGVGTAVAGAVRDFLRLDGLDDARRARIPLGVDDVDPRRAGSRRQPITAVS